MSPRPRDQESRIKDAMDGKRPLGAKEKRTLGAEKDNPKVLSFTEFVARLTPGQRNGLYDALVEVMGDED